MSKTLVSSFWGCGYIEGRLYGIEMELEQILAVDDYPKHCRSVEEDGSLRNSGREFISHPINVKRAEEFYKAVMTSKDVQWADKAQRCTERGSIHVHVNMSDRDVDEVHNLIQLYCLLEPGFFDFVSETRQNNIYCVPLWSTRMPEMLVKTPFIYVPSKWHKYTAFNCKPLENLGTLEFRHLQATENFDTFSAWLSIIDRWSVLQVTAEKLSRQEVNVLFHDVFGYPPSDKLKEQLDNSYLQLQVAHLNMSAATIQQRVKEFKTCAA